MGKNPDPVAADQRSIERAAEILHAGGLVAFPTETVYGLGGDATSDRAVARIFEAKARPWFNPLIIHLPDLAAAADVAVFDARATAAAQKFWPGPLTLVLPRADTARVSYLASAGLDTVAIRIPDHPVALALLRTVGRPIAAPSANRSGRLSPTTAAHVAQSLGDRVDMILDGDPCRIGLESTILDLSEQTARLLRPGAVVADALAHAIGAPAEQGFGDRPSDFRPKAPGALDRHYAPERLLRLNARNAGDREALLAFGPGTPADDPAHGLLNLSPAGDLVEAAANLFAMLRKLDRPEYVGIAAMPVPEHGLGIAINDRLRRAAAGSG